MVKRLLVILACLALISGLVPALIGGTASDVSAPQAGTWTTYANGDNVVALAIDGHYLWAATNGGGVVRWDMTDGSYAQYLYPQSGLASNNVRAIAVDGAGRVWAGTDRGVSVFDGSTWTTYTFENTSRRGDQVTTVTEDSPAGSFQVPIGFASQEEADAALASGYVMFGDDPTFYRYQGYAPIVGCISIWPALSQDVPVGTPVYAVVAGLAFNDIHAIATDRAGNVWFRSKDDKKVSLFDGSAWTTYLSVEAAIEAHYGDILTTMNQNHRMWTIQQPDKVWIASGSDVKVFDGHTWTTYAYNDGLPCNTGITAIVVDGSGNVWVGTRPDVTEFGSFGGGLARFDGASWTIYNTDNSGLTSNDIQAIVINEAGQIWIQAGYEPWNGINRFDGATWTTYPTIKAAIEADYEDILTTINENSLWTIEPPNKIWTTEGDGLSVFDGASWSTHTTLDSGPISNGVWTMTIDGVGQLWIATGSGVSTFDGNIWTHYTVQSTSQKRGQVTVVTEDTPAGRSSIPAGFSSREEADAALSSGYVMFGTDPTLYRYNVYEPDRGTIYIWPALERSVSAGDPVYAVKVGLASDNVRAIAISGTGQVWFGTDYGVSVFHGDEWAAYNKRDGLASDWINELVIDRAGNAWFGTYDGLSKFDGTTWTTYSATDLGLTSDRVTALAVDHVGRVWVATGEGPGCDGGGGVSVFDGNTWTAYTLENTSRRGSQVTTVTRDTPAHARAVPVNFASPEEADAALSSGCVMFGSDPTVYLYEGYEPAYGHIRFCPGLKQAVSAGTPVYAVEVGLASNWVYAFAFDSAGQVWFGTSRGVSKFDGTAWTVYSTSNSGLASNWVYAIAVDKGGSTWFKTAGGISKFDGTTWVTYPTIKAAIEADYDEILTTISQHNMWIIESDKIWIWDLWLGPIKICAVCKFTPADFSISASPSFQSIAPGEAAQVEISLAAQGGFASPLTLGVSGLPAHAEATFDPNPITPPASSTLSISTSSQTPPGTYPLTIEASGEGISHTTTATVKVAPQYKLYLPFISKNYTHVTRLTYDPAQDWQPFFSPDGFRVAFCSNRAGNYDVHLMERGMWSPINLTSSPGDEDVASFSPDGEIIAFASDRSGDWEIYLMARDGSNVRNISQNPSSDDARPRFSPDGKWIAFDSNRDGNWEIYLMDANGGNVRRLTHHPARDRLPSFSPDGDWIVFRSERDGNSEVYIMDTDGENLRRLTDDSAFDGYPSFSPDGTRILFETDRDGNHEVYLMDVDGSNPVNLTRNPANDITPSFSPDGRWIIFASERDGNREICLMPLACSR